MYFSHFILHNSYCFVIEAYDELFKIIYTCGENLCSLDHFSVINNPLTKSLGNIPTQVFELYYYMLS